MAGAYQCPLSWSILVIFYLISSKFHVGNASIKLMFKFECGFCLSSENQDGQQNGCSLSMTTIVVT